jgi:LPXTG-motif cell wall-anchored protein
VLGPGSPEAVRTTTVGNITLCLNARDNLDGSASLRITVQVVPPPAPPAPGPQAVSPTGDASLGLLLLLAAAGAAGLVLYLRRRRREPPDNV